MTTELRHSTAVTDLSAHDQIGFDLGWDHARYKLAPPSVHAQQSSALRNGWRVGVATFGARTLESNRHVRRWLQLRLHAWLRGHSVELMQVTPHYLQQIDVSHCPVTRQALGSETSEATEGSIDRVRSDASYAAGNLVVMSAKANQAKAAHGTHAAQLFARQIEEESLGGIGGLTAAQWSRVAVLSSFVQSLPHAQACGLPMLVLPPNRLRLFNPAQALQAFISQQLMVPGWSNRLSRLEELLPGKAVKRAFQTFFHALLPRVLEAGRTHKTHELRWAIEDAWRNPLALQRWTAFATQLTPAQCEAIVARAGAKKLGTLRVEQVSDEQATDGWNLDSRGYVPRVVMNRRALPRAKEAVLPATRLPQQTHLPLH